MLYNAFISYSHAADGNLASALQSALHRFAKPFYHRRAVRVFRDKSSLSVTPKLWKSIKTALDSSEYFILLASPDSAKSKWVQKEVDYWLTNKSPDKILIVVTDGTIVWDDVADSFDYNQTNALPENLITVFKQEPLYLELQFARKEKQLSLRHSIFYEGVAKLAAVLHGRPYDEIAGEDVRQHNRYIRFVWSAAAIFAVLTLFLIAAAYIAINNQRKALTNLANSYIRSSELETTKFNHDLAFTYLTEAAATQKEIVPYERLIDSYLKTSQTLWELKQPFHGLRSPVRYSRNKTQVVGQTDDEILGVWDFKTGSTLKTFKVEDKLLPFSYFFIDQNILYSTLSGIYLLNTGTGRSELLFRQQGTQYFFLSHISPNGKYYLGVTATHDYHIFDISSRKLIKKITSQEIIDQSQSELKTLQDFQEFQVRFFDDELQIYLPSLFSARLKFTDPSARLEITEGILNNGLQFFRVSENAKFAVLIDVPPELNKEQQVPAKAEVWDLTKRQMIHSIDIPVIYGGNSESETEFEKLWKNLQLIYDVYITDTGELFLFAYNKVFRSRRGSFELLSDILSEYQSMYPDVLLQDGQLLFTTVLEKKTPLNNELVLRRSVCRLDLGRNDQKLTEINNPYPVSLCVSHDGRFICRAHTDGTIELRSVSDGKLIKRIRPYPHKIKKIRYSPVAHQILASYWNGAALVYDFHLDKLVCRLGAAESYIINSQFASNGLEILILKETFKGKGDDHYQIEKLDITGKPIFVIDLLGPGFITEILQVSPARQTFYNVWRSSIEERAMKDGRLLRSIELPNIDSNVNHIAIRPDSNELLLNYKDGSFYSVRLDRLEDRFQRIITLDLSISSVHWISNLEFVFGTNSVIGRDKKQTLGDIYIYNRLEKRIKSKQYDLKYNIKELCFDPVASVLFALGTDGRVKALLIEKDVFQRIPTAGRIVLRAAYDNLLLAVELGDKIQPSQQHWKVLDLNTGKNFGFYKMIHKLDLEIYPAFDQPFPPSISPDGKYVLAMNYQSENSMDFNLYSIQTGELVKNFHSEIKAPERIIFSQTSDSFCVFGSDNAEIFSLESEHPIWNLDYSGSINEAILSSKGEKLFLLYEIGWIEIFKKDKIVNKIDGFYSHMDIQREHLVTVDINGICRWYFPDEKEVVKQKEIGPDVEYMISLGKERYLGISRRSEILIWENGKLISKISYRDKRPFSPILSNDQKTFYIMLNFEVYRLELDRIFQANSVFKDLKSRVLANVAQNLTGYKVQSGRIIHEPSAVGSKLSIFSNSEHAEANQVLKALNSARNERYKQSVKKYFRSVDSYLFGRNEHRAIYDFNSKSFWNNLDAVFAKRSYENSRTLNLNANHKEITNLEMAILEAESKGKFDSVIGILEKIREIDPSHPRVILGDVNFLINEDIFKAQEMTQDALSELQQDKYTDRRILSSFIHEAQLKQIKIHLLLMEPLKAYQVLEKINFATSPGPGLAAKLMAAGHYKEAEILAQSVLDIAFKNSQMPKKKKNKYFNITKTMEKSSLNYYRQIKWHAKRANEWATKIKPPALIVDRVRGGNKSMDLKSGDVILRLNGQSADDPKVLLSNVIKHASFNQPIGLTVLRSGREIDLQTKVDPNTVSLLPLVKDVEWYIKIVGVEPNSYADSLDMQRGDILYKVNGNRIHSLAVFQALRKKHDKIQLEFIHPNFDRIDYFSQYRETKVELEAGQTLGINLTEGALIPIDKK